MIFIYTPADRYGARSRKQNIYNERKPKQAILLRAQALKPGAQNTPALGEGGAMYPSHTHSCKYIPVNQQTDRERGNLVSHSARKPFGGPRLGSSQRSPDPLAAGKGDCLPPLQKLPLRSRSSTLQASPLVVGRGTGCRLNQNATLSNFYTHGNCLQHPTRCHERQSGGT